jgi:hypothetical protein
MAAVEDINVGVHTQQSNERKIEDDDIATTKMMMMMPTNDDVGYDNNVQ